jgi:hypothetical protein
MSYPHLQGEVMHGPLQDGIGAVVEQLERRHMSIVHLVEQTLSVSGPGHPEVLVATAWLLLCCVLWNDVRQHSMYEKIG